MPKRWFCWFLLLLVPNGIMAMSADQALANDQQWFNPLTESMVSVTVSSWSEPDGARVGRGLTLTSSQAEVQVDIFVASSHQLYRTEVLAMKKLEAWSHDPAVGEAVTSLFTQRIGGPYDRRQRLPEEPRQPRLRHILWVDAERSGFVDGQADAWLVSFTRSLIGLNRDADLAPVSTQIPGGLMGLTATILGDIEQVAPIYEEFSREKRVDDAVEALQGGRLETIAVLLRRDVR